MAGSTHTANSTNGTPETPLSRPACYHCKRHLKITDKQKTTGKYWKSCQTCRDELTARRIKRGAPDSSTDATAGSSASGGGKKRAAQDLGVPANLLKRARVATVDESAPINQSSHQIVESEQSSAQEIPFRPSPFRPATTQHVRKATEIANGGYDKTPTDRKAARDARALARSKRPYEPNPAGGDEQDDNEPSPFQAEEPPPNSDEDPISSTTGLVGDTSDDIDSAAIDPLSTECSVCTDTFPTSTFPALAPCTHAADVCKTCFLQWLTSQMSSVENITCPSSGCPTLITHGDVQEHAPLDVFTLFDELSMRTLLSADENFLYCLAEGCSSGQVHDTGVEGPIFRCAACGSRMCTAHTPVIPFHENESCVVYTQRLERQEREANETPEAQCTRLQEEASRAEVEKTAVECPGCEVPIHKISGCDHMTCKFSIRLPRWGWGDVYSANKTRPHERMRIPVLLSVSGAVRGGEWNKYRGEFCT